jgi:uncharacterized protein (DUF427 family)
MKAQLGDKVLAEAPDHEIVRIEGNAYFPPDAVNREHLADSATPYTCAWKGSAQYFHVVVDGETYENRAWSYPDPHQTAVERVGKDFSNYVAFWKEVDVA